MKMKMKRMKSAIKISAVIVGLFGGMPAFAQNDIEVQFNAGKYGYKFISSVAANCSGQTCHFSSDQINSVRVKLSLLGTTYICSFYGGKEQGTPFFTGVCPREAGTALVTNSLITNPNNPVIVNLP